MILLKRVLTLALSALLMIFASLGAFAEAAPGAEDSPRIFTGDDFTFEIPDIIAHDMAGVDSGDVLWGIVGVTDSATEVQDNEEHGVISDLYSEDGAMNIKVMSRSNDTTMSVFNLKDMSEEDKASFLEQLITTDMEGIEIERKYIDVGGQPFYYLRTDGNLEQYGEAHEIIYGTIFNGHTLNFDIHSSDADLPEPLVEALASLVNSIKITKVMTPEEVEAQNAPPPLEPRQYIPILIVCAFLVLVVVVPIIYLPIRSRIDKKRRAVMNARLSEYEKQHHGKDWDAGELKFANATECTREAIRSFSIFHSFLKQFVSVFIGTAVCVAIIIAVFVFDMDWFFKLLAVAATGFFLYRVISMPRRVERIQQKLLIGSTTHVAQYSFYENAFRVSGTQPATMYPYFRIVSVNTFGHYAYLYYGTDNAYLVDRHGFSVGEWNDFIKFIKEKTSKDAQKEEKK